MILFVLSLLVFNHESNAVHLVRPSNSSQSRANHFDSNLMSKIFLDPNAFVASTEKWDENLLIQVIDLLQGFEKTSKDAEEGLAKWVDHGHEIVLKSQNALVSARDALSAAKIELQHAEKLVSKSEREHDDNEGYLKAAQKAYDEQVPRLKSEQEVIDKVLTLLEKFFSTDCCSGGSKLHAILQEGKVIACQGQFSGHPKDADFCGNGWHTCNGFDVHKKYLVNYEQATSFDGCYAYDTMNDCGGCWVHCEDNAKPLKKGGCLDYDARPGGNGHDLAAMGKDCYHTQQHLSCLVDGLIGITGYKRKSCIIQESPVNGGVICCKD